MPIVPLISLRVVSIDYYMAPPLPSTFVNSQGRSDGEPVLYQPQHQHIPRDAEEYPVLRIFGSTPGGQKTCAHIHGSLPYLLARPSYNEESSDYGRACHGLLHAFSSTSILKTWTRRLLTEISAKLDSTLVFLSKRNDEESGCGDYSDGELPHKTAQQYIQRPLVYSVEVVERIPIYGFHPKELPYLKITLFNPKHISLLAGVLRSGVIQGVEMQPHEAHINNILQAMIDHDVGGMDYLHLRDCRFRSPMPDMPERIVGTSQTPSSRGTPATPFSLSTSPGSMSSTKSPSKRRQRKSPASPFTGRNEHRLWWAHNTPSKMVQDYSRYDHGHSTRGQENEIYPGEQTASQLMQGIDPRDFELSQAIYGGTKSHEEFILDENTDLPEPEVPLRDESPPRPPDHLSRSRCSLEIDATIHHILNKSMRVDEDVQAENIASKSTKKAFRAVNSLTGMWAEERDRARRLGLSSQIDAPTEATPPGGNIVNRGLANAVELEQWKRSMSDLASKSSNNVPNRPTSFPQEENVEPNKDAEVERVLASQASFEALSRKSRRAEFRTIHENGDEENEGESEDMSDEDGDSSAERSSSQVFTQLSQTSVASDDVESKQKSVASSQLKRRNSSFLTQEQQRHIESMLSQDELAASNLPAGPFEEAPDHNFLGANSAYEDLLTAEEDEGRWWLSQPVLRETLNDSEVHGDDEVAIDAGSSPISAQLSIGSSTSGCINLSYENATNRESDGVVVEDNSTLQGTHLLYNHDNCNEDDVRTTSAERGHSLLGRYCVERENLECPSQLFSLSSSPADNPMIHVTGSRRTDVSEDVLTVLRPSAEPPSAAHVVATLRDYGLQFEVPVEPYFSVQADVQTAPLPNHSRRRTLPKFIDDLPSFDTTPHRQLFHDKRFHKRICSRQKTAKRLALGIEKQRQMNLSNFRLSVSVPSRVVESGIWLMPLLPPPPSPQAVTSWVQRHSVNKDVLALGSTSIVGGASSVNQQVPTKGLLSRVDEHSDDDGEEFSMDANTGKMIPTMRPKRRKLFDAQRNSSAHNPPLASDAHALDVNSEVDAHPLFLTNPERARANGYPLTAQLALEIRESVHERSLSNGASLTMPPPPPSPMKAKSPVMPPALPRHSAGGFVAAQRASRTPSSVFRQVSQVPLPTQSPRSSCASGEVAKGGANKRAAPEGFQLTGSGGTVSSSVGRRVSVLCIEVVGATRHQLLPDPEVDAALFVCWRLLDTFGFDAETEEHHRASGAILNLDPRVVEHDGADRSNSSGVGTPLPQHAAKQSWHRALGEGVDVAECASELELFLEVEALFELYDPDVVVGWDIQRASLKWLLDRTAALRPRPLDLVRRLSRVPSEPPHQLHGADEWGAATSSDVHLTGIVCLTLWRMMRDELKLCSYTLEAVAAHVLHKRVPHVPAHVLCGWYGSSTADRCRAVRLVLDRCDAELAILEKLDLLNRYAESARLYGIPFFDVISRGSQYRVEAVLMRVMKPLGYVAPSPHKQQVSAQAAIEVIPLVLEPKSAFYTSPVIVLDFQSLYPSMVLAYNLCYSTCLGKLTKGESDPRGPTTGRLGFTSFSSAKSAQGLASCAEAAASNHQEQRLDDDDDDDDDDDARYPFVCPTGTMFCKPQTRVGVLPQMLREILETRFMVKRAMKRCLGDHPVSGQRVIQDSGKRRTLENVLHARQFALKMIANVTYGYTAASFTGRMPCSELADAIVKAGRHTLEHAIEMVESETVMWSGASVVYGDTDSLFVHLPGKTMAQAFEVGRAIAQAVTDANPKDVVLQFEKVYSSCLLVSKKRYVGLCFESPDQKHGSLDSKGIEIVRRDNCPAVGKMQEKALRLLFTTRDGSQVKGWLVRQWQALLGHRVRANDYIFAKEAKPFKDSDRPPVHAVVSARAAAKDHRAAALRGERVPYVVVYAHGDEAGLGRRNKLPRLMDCVVDPRELLAPGSNLRLNGYYYITKQILPALARVLNIAGLDPHKWFEDMHRPRPVRALRPPSQHTQAMLAALGFTPSPQAASSSRYGAMMGAAASSSSSHAPQQKLLTSYLLTEHCVLCDQRCKDNVCDRCRTSGAAASLAQAQHAQVQRHVHAAQLLCARCLHVNDGGAWGGAAPHNARHPFATSHIGGAAPSPGRHGTLPPNDIVAPWRPMTTAACDSVDCPVLCKRANLREQLASALDLVRDLEQS